MTRPLNSDPLRNFRFNVTISHPQLPTLAQLGFMSVSGIGVQNNVIPYREGGNNTTALPLNSPVLTVNGWKRMGDIEVGDRVIDPRGHDSKVVDIIPAGRKAVYRVTMQDGSVAEACYGHLWEIQTRDSNNRKAVEVVTTLEMKERVDKKHWQVLLPRLAPFWYEAIPELPLPPYMLGLLLAEGSIEEEGVSFASADEEIVEAMRQMLPEGHSLTSYGIKHRITVGNGGSGPRNISGRNRVLSALRELGLTGHRAWEKFVPEVYKRASISDRWELLQGIMDGDGWVNNRGSAMFCSTSPQLARDVRELVISLGGRCRVTEKTGRTYVYKGERRAARDAYSISGMAGLEFNPFLLERKSKKYQVASQKSDSYFRKVVSVEYVREDDVQCIEVSAPSHLFISHDFVPSHNTRKMPGQSDFSPLSLSRGMMAAPVSASGSSIQMYQWLTQIFSVTTGPSYVNPGVTDFRVGVTLDVLAFPTAGPTATVGFENPPPIKARFQFYNCFPMGLSYSDFEAGGNAVEIESMTIAHEGWSLIEASQAPGNYLSASAGFSG